MSFKQSEIFGSKRLHFHLMRTIENKFLCRDVETINNCKIMRLEVTNYPRKTIESVKTELEERGFIVCIATDRKGTYTQEANNLAYDTFYYIRTIIEIRPDNSTVDTAPLELPKLEIFDRKRQPKRPELYDDDSLSSFVAT